MLNTAKAAKEIVRDSAGDNPMDVLGEFDRTIVGGKSVRIHLPLRDPIECARHLEMIEERCRKIRLRLKQGGRDRSQLFMVRGEIRELHQKINAYRSGTSD